MNSTLWGRSRPSEECNPRQSGPHPFRPHLRSKDRGNAIARNHSRRLRANKLSQGTQGKNQNIPTALTRYIVDGKPLTLSPGVSFSESNAFLDEGTGRMVLTVILQPDAENLKNLSAAWKLHPVLVDDLMHAGQRPKVERYDDVLFLAVRSARYIDRSEEVEFSEFHLLIRGEALVVICQDGRLIDGTVVTPNITTAADAPLGSGAPMLENTELMKLGPESMVYQLLDTIVDRYFPVLDGLQTDKDQIERQVFSGDAAATERIYRLSEEVIDLLQASTALSRVLIRLQEGAAKYEIPPELQTYLQDVSDHLARVVTEATELRDSLSQILNVNATLVAQRQNEDMKKISGWAAILFAPTLIGAIYGMNFDVMPELHWAFGYHMAIATMVALAATLYLVFKIKKWM